MKLSRHSPVNSNTSIAEQIGQQVTTGQRNRPRNDRSSPGSSRPRTGSHRPQGDEQRAIAAALEGLHAMLSGAGRSNRRNQNKPDDLRNTPVGLLPDTRPQSDPKKYVGMRVSEAQIQARRDGLTDIRVVKDGSLYTKDYRPGRLNLFVDQTGSVTRANMG
jgi:hypothetical protein